MTDLDFLSPKEIYDYQNRKLSQLLSYLSNQSPFYRDMFREHKIDPAGITSMNQLHQIPVTTKDDLQKRNLEFLCVPPDDIVEYCSTSGTMGSPVTIGLTEKDLQRLSRNEYLSFRCAGATKKDIILLMLSLDRQFMAGVAYFLGARELGAGIIRGGPGNHSMHLDTILRLKPTVLVAVPSFISSFITYASQNGVDLNKTSVKKIICIGENIRNTDLSPNPLGEKIGSRWNVMLHSTYASTEQQTAFTECEYGRGGHHQPELLIFEVLDENNQPLAPGEPGELTITTLGVEGFPLLRYKTGDMVTRIDTPCSCKRSTHRISPVLGRKQQLIKYHGTTLYPQTIFNAMNALNGVADYVVCCRKNDLGLDEIEVMIATVTSASFSEHSLINHLQSKLRIVPKISYHSTDEIQKMQNIPGKRKITRFIDERSGSLTSD